MTIVACRGAWAFAPPWKLHADCRAYREVEITVPCKPSPIGDEAQSAVRAGASKGVRVERSLLRFAARPGSSESVS